jgi:hypothetical protein
MSDLSVQYKGDSQLTGGRQQSESHVLSITLTSEHTQLTIVIDVLYRPVIEVTS